MTGATHVEYKIRHFSKFLYSVRYIIGHFQYPKLEIFLYLRLQQSLLSRLLKHT